MPPEKCDILADAPGVATASITIPKMPAAIVPLLLTPPPKVVIVSELFVPCANAATMIPVSSAAIVPPLRMPPENFDIATDPLPENGKSAKRMPVDAAIRPPLLMPPEKLVTPVTVMPFSAPDMVPLLLMPPENVDTLKMERPLKAEMSPALRMPLAALALPNAATLPTAMPVLTAEMMPALLITPPKSRGLCYDDCRVTDVDGERTGDDFAMVVNRYTT